MSTNNQSEYLDKLVEYLIINNVNLINNGLYHGKMGIVICLCEYARYINDDIYLDLAGDLLDEIISKIDMHMPINYENGLCGIGWGIEYLIRQKYMFGNSDEILEELDARVMQIDIDRMVDFSVETGLGGIALYMIARITAKDRIAGNAIPFDLKYLESWRLLLSIGLSKGKYPNVVQETFVKLLNLLRALPYISKEQMNFPSFIYLGDLKKLGYTPLSFIPKGLDGGIAGMVLQMM